MNENVDILIKFINRKNRDTVNFRLRIMLAKNWFSIVSYKVRKQVLSILIAVVIGLLYVFMISGKPLNTSVASFGIISFELAGSVVRAQSIIASWGNEGLVRASFGLGLDFLFIPVYVFTLGLGSAISQDVLRVRKWPFAKAGILVSYCVVAAGFFDIIENISLTRIIFTSANSPWPQLAACCAIIKFLLIFLAIMYSAFGGVISLIIRKHEG